MNTITMLCLFSGFAICLVIAPFLINYLRKLKVRQTERQEGVKSHLEKAGTPTMGGIMILCAFLVSQLFVIAKYPQTVPVLFMTLGFGIIGFIDDYLKVVLKRSDGLMPRQKMVGMIALTAVFVVYLWIMRPECLEVILPFTGGKKLAGLAVRIAATPLAFFAIIGTVNGVNFTDGLDGLASTVTMVAAGFIFAASARLGGGLEPACAGMIGALAGFLIHNAYPARVFMGDTGSLALGGFVASCAYLLQMPLFILLFGVIYLIEVLSVIIQVTYFKKTGGKRIFKMSPFHHHLELGGWTGFKWSETRIVVLFALITLFMSVISWAAM